MKKNQPAASTAKNAKKTARRPLVAPSPESVTIQLTAAQIATWRQKALDQGFRTLEDWASYNLCAYAWPSDRLSITTNPERFLEWNRASLKQKVGLLEWITATLDSKAFEANNAERIESVLDARAFARASAGELVSFEEFERAERYRAKHPAQAAAADLRRPVESASEALLRDKPYATPSDNTNPPSAQ